MPILDEIVAEAGLGRGLKQARHRPLSHGRHDRSLADIDRVLASSPPLGAIAGIG
jgi:hypothetical protein